MRLRIFTFEIKGSGLLKSVFAIFFVFILGQCSTIGDEPLKGDEDWSFVVFGDVRQGYGIYSKLAAIIGELEPVPCAALLVGDVMLWPGNEAEWLTFNRYSEPITGKMPLLIVRGNHEGNDPASEEILRDFGNFPRDDFYYAYQCRSALFIILDTEIRGEEGSIAGEQLAWLADRLDAASADEAVGTVFVFLHRPLFPKGLHQNSPLGNAGELHQLFKSHAKVRAVFSGHDHLFNRYVRDGMNYITTGGAGSALYRGYGGDYFHFVKVSFYEDENRINIKTIGIFREIVEDFDL